MNEDMTMNGQNNNDEELVMGLDLESFYRDNETIPEDISNEKLREANKKLPQWNIVPQTGYREDK